MCMYVSDVSKYFFLADAAQSHNAGLAINVISNIVCNRHLVSSQTLMNSLAAEERQICS